MEVWPKMRVSRLFGRLQLFCWGCQIDSRSFKGDPPHLIFNYGFPAHLTESNEEDCIGNCP